MPQCYVETCRNYYEKTRGSKDIIYHMLPGDPVLALKWIHACGKKKQTLPYYARVCSDHFSEKCYQRDLQHELLGKPQIIYKYFYYYYFHSLYFIQNLI